MGIELKLSVWVRGLIEQGQLKGGRYRAPDRQHRVWWVDRADAKALKHERANHLTRGDRS